MCLICHFYIYHCICDDIFYIFRLIFLFQTLKLCIYFEKNYPRHELIPYSIYERAKIFLKANKATEAENLYKVLAEGYPAHPILRTIFFNISEKLKNSVNFRTVASGAGFMVILENPDDLEVMDAFSKYNYLMIKKKWLGEGK